MFSRNRVVLSAFKVSLLTSGRQSRHVTIDSLNLFVLFQPGVVAHACNPVAWRLGLLNGLRAGFLGVIVYVDQVSALSLASTWLTQRILRCPGQLKRNKPAQGGNTAGKSSRVKQ